MSLLVLSITSIKKKQNMDVILDRGVNRFVHITDLY